MKRGEKIMRGRKREIERERESIEHRGLMREDNENKNFCFLGFWNKN